MWAGITEAASWYKYAFLELKELDIWNCEGELWSDKKITSAYRRTDYLAVLGRKTL